MEDAAHARRTSSMRKQSSMSLASTSRNSSSISGGSRADTVLVEGVEVPAVFFSDSTLNLNTGTVHIYTHIYIYIYVYVLLYEHMSIGRSRKGKNLAHSDNSGSDDDDEAMSARAPLWQPRRPRTRRNGGQCRSDAEGGTHEVCPKSRSPHPGRGNEKMARSPRGASRLQGSGGGSAGAFSSTRR